MFCPTCHSEYRDGFYRCSDCDVDLVQSLEAAPKVVASGEDPTHRLDLVLIFESVDSSLINLAASLLRGAEIEYITTNDPLRASGLTMAPVAFRVRRDDAEEAVALLHDLSPDEGGRILQHDHLSTGICTLQITRYRADGSLKGTEEIEAPTWEEIESEVRSMDRFEKPMLWLLSEVDNTETHCMAVTGGDGLYHVQIADEEGEWTEAVNPDGGSEVIELWTSDQGLSVERRFTWDLEQTLKIVYVYWSQEQPSPDVKWE